MELATASSAGFNSATSRSAGSRGAAARVADAVAAASAAGRTGTDYVIFSHTVGAAVSAPPVPPSPPAACPRARLAAILAARLETDPAGSGALPDVGGFPVAGLTDGHGAFTRAVAGGDIAAPLSDPHRKQCVRPAWFGRRSCAAEQLARMQNHCPFLLLAAACASAGVLGPLADHPLDAAAAAMIGPIAACKEAGEDGQGGEPRAPPRVLHPMPTDAPHAKVKPKSKVKATAEATPMKGRPPGSLNVQGHAARHGYPNGTKRRNLSRNGLSQNGYGIGNTDNNNHSRQNELVS